MSASKILVVDDEQDLVWAVKYTLSDEGYDVLTARNGVEAIAAAQQHHPDLVVLDIIMPEMDGVQVCHRLRRDPCLATVPILFLTMRDTIEDRVNGLDEGGDDYLVKPFDLDELKARIRALLRRAKAGRVAPLSAQSSLLMLDDLRLDLRTHEVYLGKKSLLLTPAEFDLLRHFLMHSGEVLTTQQLLEQVWGYTSETTAPGLVRWHIMNLRNKIEPNPANPIYLRTVPRHGYIMDRPHGSFPSGIQESLGSRV
jgi:DNA-binding response OmpR family regulator